MRRSTAAAVLSGIVLPAVIAVAAGLAGRAPAPAAGPRSLDPPRSVTLPFTTDHNRMIVDVEFVRPDGAVRAARAWVDTGNPALTVGESLAHDLGLDLSGLRAGETQRFVESASPAPPMRLRGLALDMRGIKVLVHAGVRVLPGVPAEANLPASALRHDHVVFDYPAGRLTVARLGVLRPRGYPVPCLVNDSTGLFQVAATLDGGTQPLGVDVGSAGTWVSDKLTKAWRARHPDWPYATGAVGSANFFGFGFEAAGTLMRLPELALGNLRVHGVGLLGLDQGLFDWYSQKTAAPVAGFIGANVLKRFRLEVVYPLPMTYWEPGPVADAGDFDIVGLTVRPEPDGHFTVAGVAAKDGKPTVDGVRPGDGLLRVDRLDTANADMGAVVAALRGKPGTTRTLVIERAGSRRTVTATVARFP